VKQAVQNQTPDACLGGGDHRAIARSELPHSAASPARDVLARPIARCVVRRGNDRGVQCDVVAAKAAVREFNDAGDLVRATGVRPFPIGKTFVPRRWGGDFGEYTDFAGTRVPSFGEAWDLPEGRFVYWRDRVTALELLGAES
jgi:hypothetical protein